MPVMPAAAIALFLCAYFCSLLAISLLLCGNLTAQTRSLTLFQALRGAPRGQWFLIIAVVSFAGLPPFFLFFAKVALLAELFKAGSWLLVGAGLFLLFLGWYLYCSVALRALVTRQRNAGPATASRLQGQYGVLLLVTCYIFFCGGLYLFDLWLLVS